MSRYLIATLRPSGNWLPHGLAVPEATLVRLVELMQTPVPEGAFSIAYDELEMAVLTPRQLIVLGDTIGIKPEASLPRQLMAGRFVFCDRETLDRVAFQNPDLPMCDVSLILVDRYRSGDWCARVYYPGGESQESYILHPDAILAALQNGDSEVSAYETLCANTGAT